MSSDGKRYRFFLAETGEIIHTITLDDEPSEKKLDEIRLQLAYDKGYEANSIDYDEE